MNDGSGSLSDSGLTLGNYSSAEVALGDVDGDGDLDAFVASDSEANQVWLNDGSGSFSLSGNSLGGSYSQDVSLGDLDGDGDLDSFVANNAPNRVWLNAPNSDSDGIADVNDNCPDDNNPGQEDLDGDGSGNLCDADNDVDGDGIDDSSDTDDDNDGIPDLGEPGGDLDNPHAFDPDRDGDGIIDGLDRDLGSELNNLCIGEAPDAILSESIVGDSTCADPSSVTTQAPPASVTSAGDLLIISPLVSFDANFFVAPGGELKVISRDPTAPITNP